MDADNNKKKEDRVIDKVAIATGNTDTVSRYGSANGEHIVAYKGIDNETGKIYLKGLKQISESRVHPDYKKSNIKQQAGYSAEVKSAAKKNAEKYINGDTKSKASRTDDISMQSDGKGNTIGGINDQLYDIAEIDNNGMYVDGTASQLKFVGGTAEQCAKKLINAKYDKYRDANVPIEIPSDFYNDVISYYENEIGKINSNIDKAENKGNHALADKLRRRRDKIVKTKNNLRKSNVSNKEALFAREHPRLSTAVDMAKISHRAGIEAAKYGAAIGGTISATRNIIAFMQGNKDIQEVLCDTTIDTGKSALLGYGTVFAGSLVKAGMQKSTLGTLRQLSRTSLPSLVVTVTLELGTSIHRYAKGEIDSVQFLEEIGEKGSGLLAGGLMATIGQIAIPIPVVGSVIGGMVGYTISSLFYRSSLQALQEAKQAEMHYQIIKAECEEARRTMLKYQTELQRLFEIHLSELKEQLYTCFSCMNDSVNTNNMDDFATAANNLGVLFGKTLQFGNMQEFDVFMKSDEILML